MAMETHHFTKRLSLKNIANTLSWYYYIVKIFFFFFFLEDWRWKAWILWATLNNLD